MPIAPPSPEQLHALSSALGFQVDQAEAREYIRDMRKILDEVYLPLDGIPDNLPAVNYPRTPGYAPDADEDPLHIWYRKTSIKGAESGPLHGSRVAVKDSVCVAGVAMMNGASSLEGYVPDVDATVVTRLLDAGAQIAGKTHCEYFCVSAGSHTNATGVTLNPHRHDCTSGGSSSGSAVAVATGAADMAIGGDQAGSIRVPSSFCGVVGMKPTYGLVPYTAIMPIEMTLDHAGPMTRDTMTNARMLEVIAGPDGLDPRQAHSPPGCYLDAIEQGVSGLRIGILDEAFGLAVSQQDVDETVTAAARRLESLGAVVKRVSVPKHRSAALVWVPIMLEGMNALLLHGNALGTNWKGLYPTGLLDAHSSWRTRSASFPAGLKSLAILGEHVRQSSHGHHYAKAQNLSRALTAAYDNALTNVDLLIMPTTPTVAPLLPDAEAIRSGTLEPGMETLVNTAAFNCTGHPALTLPCGITDGLPVGMSLVGKHYDEATIYRVAHAYESAFDWQAEATT